MRPKPDPNATIVIALGGNAILRPGEGGSVEDQFVRTEESMKRIAGLVEEGYSRLVLTHGNGPQIGNILLRSELSHSTEGLPRLPFPTAVSDSQGGMGYMIQQTLHNALVQRNLDRSCYTVLTQTLVDPDDPAFDDPQKPIGTFYDPVEGMNLSALFGWEMKKFPSGKLRRVVPSPRPIDIVEKKAIRQLLALGHILVAVGGGGIPVVRREDGTLRGIDAVVDKDRATVFLASYLQAEFLLILTGVERIQVNFGTSDARDLDVVRAAEMGSHLANGEFPKGSMGPKVEACLEFLAHGGRAAIVTDPENCDRAIKGETGTWIVP